MAPQQAGVGEWSSPITSDLITAKTIRFSYPVWVGKNQVVWLEGRPQEGGRTSAVKWSPDTGIADITPPPESGLNIRTRVHEYGGGAHIITPDGRTMFFSNMKDQRVWRQSLACGVDGSYPAPEAVTADGANQRFADYAWDAGRARLLAVCEAHGEAAADVHNTLVAIDPSTGAVTTLVSGSDFVSEPRPSPDGSRLAWVSWDFPAMPWDNTLLQVGQVDPETGAVTAFQRVAGGPEESVQQPQWSADGARLFFVSDSSGWWNLYCWEAATQKVSPVLPMDADFGVPQWVFGTCSYQQLDSTHILAVFSDPKEAGVCMGLIDLAARTLTNINAGATHYGGPTTLAASTTDGLAIVSVVSGPTISPRVAVLRVPDVASLAAVGPGDWVTLRSSADVQLDEGYLSVPQAIEYPTTGGKTAHMVYYPPASKDWAYPPGVLPPLLVHSHGGPTSAAAVSLSLHTLYFTSRGWAVADINYGGSTGYGREFRNRLRGTWGITDVDDCSNAATYLAEQGRVDPTRMCISGGSAGGYTTLACLAFRSVFSAGCSLYGVADLMLLAKDTHKFESRYLDQLVGPLPAAQAVYDERSPIKHVQGFTRPVIFFQGDEDAVVPPQQAILMHAAIKERGLPTALVMFKGEQHGFRQAASIRAALDGELFFYSQVLGFPGVMPPGVEAPVIDNLATSGAA